MEELGNVVENNENYQELKETTKSFLQLITSDSLYYGLFLLVVMGVAVKVVDLVFKPFEKRGRILPSFIKAMVKIFIVFMIGMRIISLIPALENFASQIILSSSLLVVVMGFVLQEGLTNIVHGFILSVFKPFELGDRVTATIDGEKITGYVKEITARHTVLCSVINSTHVIVPNSKMDMCTIANNNYDMHESSSAFMDVTITYDSDVDRAREVIAAAIEENPLVEAERKLQKITDPVDVMVRDLEIKGIALRGFVITRTVEQNFATCSQIRLDIIHRINQEENVHFACLPLNNSLADGMEMGQ